MAESQMVAIFKLTSQKHPPLPYLNWLDFWEKKTGHKAGRCAHHCKRNAEVGAHVQYMHRYFEYIVPLCGKCCERNDEFAVYKTLVRPE